MTESEKKEYFQIADDGGKWIIDIQEDNIIIWDKAE